MAPLALWYELFNKSLRHSPRDLLPFCTAAFSFIFPEQLEFLTFLKTPKIVDTECRHRPPPLLQICEDYCVFV